MLNKDIIDFFLIVIRDIFFCIGKYEKKLYYCVFFMIFSNLISVINIWYIGGIIGVRVI